jgi:hypothetical protein
VKVDQAATQRVVVDKDAVPCTNIPCLGGLVGNMRDVACMLAAVSVDVVDVDAQGRAFQEHQ